MQPQAVIDVEALLQQLLQPDTELIRQATARLKVYFQKNAVIVVLAEILAKSPNWPVRQLAAVLLRQLLMKSWKRLAAPVKAHLKTAFLQALVADPKPLVQHSIAAIIAAIAKYELGAKPWPELLDLTNRCCVSAEVPQREVGMFLLSSIAADSTQILEPYFDHFLQLMVRMLQDRDSAVVRVHAFQTLKELIELADTPARLDQFQRAIPFMLDATRELIAAGDDESAIRAFEVFDDLVGTEAPVLNKHLGALLELFVGTALNSNLEEGTRVHALTFVTWVAELKPRELRKLNIVDRLIVALIRLLFETPTDPADRAEHELGQAASQTLDVVVKHLAPEITVPAILREVQTLSKSPEVPARNAAIIAITVMIEGARDYLRDHVAHVAAFVVEALKDPASAVRESALVALDEMSVENGVTDHGTEYFDEDMSALHPVIMPALFDAIRDPQGIVAENAVSSLEAYTEHLDENILPYLAPLMELYMQQLGSDLPAIRESVVCGIGSAAHAAGPKFLPFVGVIDHLLRFMALTEPENLELRAITTDTIGTVAIALGRQAFDPYLGTALARALEGVATIDEARLRECTWQLFASLAQLYEADFAPFLPQAMPMLLKSAVSKEGIFKVGVDAEEAIRGGPARPVPEYVEALTKTETDDDAAWTDAEAAAAGDDEDDDGEELVEPTTFMFERATAVAAIGEICARLGTHFLPYVTETVAVLKQAMSDFHAEIREQAVDSVGRLMRAFHTIFDGGVNWKDSRSTATSTETQQLVAALVRDLVAQLRDDERAVVSRTLVTLADLLTVLGPVIIREQDVRQEVGNRLMDVLLKKAPCQVGVADDDGAAEDDEDEDRSAEMDAMLIDAAADVIGATALVMGPDFADYFRVFWPQIQRYYKPSKPTAERSMAVGCAAEVAAGMREGVLPFADALATLFLKALRDKEAEVRRNAVYGLGCLCESGGAALASANARASAGSLVSSMYPTFLMQMQPLFAEQSERAILDNLGGAVSRMIVTQPMAVPLQAVLPVYLQVVPPVEDYDEVHAVVRCLLFLLQQVDSNPVRLPRPHLPAQIASAYGRIVEVLATVLGPPMEQLRLPDRTQVIEALRQQAQSGRLQSTLSSLSVDAQTILSSVLSG